MFGLMSLKCSVFVIGGLAIYTSRSIVSAVRLSREINYSTESRPPERPRAGRDSIADAARARAATTPESASIGWEFGVSLDKTKYPLRVFEGKAQFKACNFRSKYLERKTAEHGTLVHEIERLQDGTIVNLRPHA
jgi:hypothetical protein